MGVALHHGQTGPAAQLLQHGQRRAALDVPAGPGVAQVVEAQPGQPGALAGLVPSVVADLAGWRVGHLAALSVFSGLPAWHREHPDLVLAALQRQHTQCIGIERHGVGASGLHFVGFEPADAALHVDLAPAQKADVAFAQSGGQAEGCHGGQVWRQLGQ